jgi:hypothetical protein
MRPIRWALALLVILPACGGSNRQLDEAALDAADSYVDAVYRRDDCRAARRVATDAGAWYCDAGFADGVRRQIGRIDLPGRISRGCEDQAASGWPAPVSGDCVVYQTFGRTCGGRIGRRRGEVTSAGRITVWLVHVGDDWLVESTGWKADHTTFDRSPRC